MPLRKEAAKDVIVAITDEHKGAARAAATKEGYKTFIIPDNVGGRFSVLTPVGLLPIAVAGFDVQKLVEGAQVMEKETSVDVPFANNIAARYAAVRQGLYSQAGKKIEIVANFQPKLHFFAEWWKGAIRKGIRIFREREPENRTRMGFYLDFFVTSLVILSLHPPLSPHTLLTNEHTEI